MAGWTCVGSLIGAVCSAVASLGHVLYIVGYSLDEGWTYSSSVLGRGLRITPVTVALHTHRTCVMQSYSCGHGM